MPAPTPLATVFKHLLKLALPLPLLATACDLHDVYRVTVPAQEILTEEQLDTLCGDMSFEQCHKACTHVMTRLASMPDTLDITALCAGDYCEVVDCEPQRFETLEMTCSCSYVAGRRPDGLQSEGLPQGGDPVGRWLAEVAHLEAAAVFAFANLARELAHHGAPQDLVDRALDAARDEVIHADLTSALALQRGVIPQVPEVAPFQVRSLMDMALDNASEGCVLETFAALMASWQAQTAQDTAIRTVMARIARDETRHGELARDIDVWLRPKLSKAQARQVEAARRDALATLGQQPQPASVLVTCVGLPDQDTAQTLAREFQRALA